MLLSLSFLTLASLSLNLPSVHRNVEEKKKKKKQQFNPTHQLIIFFVFKYIQFSNLSFFCHHRLDNFYSLLLFFPPPPLFSLSLFNKFPSDNWNAMSSVKTICIYETFQPLSFKVNTSKHFIIRFNYYNYYCCCYYYWLVLKHVAICGVICLITYICENQSSPI